MIVLQSAVNEATFEVLCNALMVTKTPLDVVVIALLLIM